MSFAVYLLSEKVIDLKALSKVMGKQMRTQKSLLEVFIDELEISHQIICQLISSYEDQKGKSFHDFLCSSNLINAEIIQKGFDIQRESQKSISEILVEENILSLDEVEKFLYDYVSLKPSLKKEQIPSDNSSLNEDEAQVSSAALDSIREQVEAGVLDQGVLDELENSANEKSEKVEEQENDTESQISLAALDSIREQVGAGVLDASVLDELESSANEEPEKIEKQENDNEPLVSLAALDSIREQVEAGVLDPSVLEQLTQDLKQEEKVEDNTEHSPEFDIQEEEYFISKIFLEKVRGTEIDSSSMDFISQTLNEGEIKKYLGMIQQLMNVKDIVEAKTISKDLAECFHLQRGGAKIMNALLLEKCLAFLEKVFDGYSEFSELSENKKEALENILRFLKKSLELKLSIEKNKSEVHFLDENESELLTLQDSIVSMLKVG